MFEIFDCPVKVDPLALSQLCIYHYVNIVPAVINKLHKKDGQVYT